jgi:hypothetical protein
MTHARSYDQQERRAALQEQPNPPDAPGVGDISGDSSRPKTRTSWLIQWPGPTNVDFAVKPDVTSVGVNGI